MLFAVTDVWVHVYHCDPYTGFLNRRALQHLLCCVWPLNYHVFEDVNLQDAAEEL